MTARRSEAGRAGRAGLPSMTVLLDSALRDERFADSPRAWMSAVLTEAAEAARQALGDGDAAPTVEALLDAAAERLRVRVRQRLCPVINATGVVLHTNLGRAPLSAAAIAAVNRVAGGYCNLEFDLESGERGRRGGYVESLLCLLTGAEAALVVNNNAAATMLTLAALAGGREVLVSRGQLIEIGGSFRLPEVMAGGGAVLREVGTTNKTRLSDYAAAICERTALVMHVHTSNYRVVGFVESVSRADLARLAHEARLPFYDDLGSGALAGDAAWRSADEPLVADSLAAGADVVSFSGDKLLGGPQAGLLVGRSGVIDRLRGHPMARAVRVDKLTLAALEATLELYATPGRAAGEIPALARLLEGVESLAGRAEQLCAALRGACPGESFDVAEEVSEAGGGALPGWSLPTRVVRWRPRQVAVAAMADRLRRGAVPVVARVRDDALLFDVRTLGADELSPLASAVRAAAPGAVA